MPKPDAPSKNSDNVLVRVTNLQKKFCRNLKQSLWYGATDIISEILGGRDHDGLREDEFWAVNNVSFELRRGECIGLIGRNGAGKTTLLKILNGLIKPDQGRIEMHGRIGALIALGTGFNPILTGRENIYVYGSVLGMTKREIDERFEEIVEFSELGEFIDAPVRSYSSGMQVRLGFSVATTLEPDVLLLDEVMAVGDAAFRNKCYARIISLRQKAAVIFVSHSMEQVSRICNTTLVLSRGNVSYLGQTAEGINAYERLNQSGKPIKDSFLSVAPPITEFSCELQRKRLTSGEPLSMRFSCLATAPLSEFSLRLAFYNRSGIVAADCHFSAAEHGIALQNGRNMWELHLGPISLRQGSYPISINLISPSGEFIVWSYKNHTLVVEGGFGGAIADYQLQLQRWTPVDNVG